METYALLTDPDLADMRHIVLTALVAGLSVTVMCGILSPLVVVKKLGFVGQGVSHSAFGGIGIAAVLGATGWINPGGAAEFAVIVAFCIAAALGMASVSDRRTTPVDTAIGLFLVGSMALGAVLVQASGSQTSWESILFGSILVAGEREAMAGWALASAIALAAWWWRRPMLFWTFDEDSAAAFGVPAKRMKLTLMILLTLAVVTAMKLAGVILATALLVLPGAIALRMSDRLWTVVALSVGAGVAGLVGGFIASIELNWQAGPSMVLVLTLMFALTAVWGWASSRRAAV